MKNKVTTETMSGEELINEGFTEDFFAQPVAITETYTLRIFNKGGDVERFVFLRQEDWEILWLEDTGNCIVDKGGLDNWYKSEKEQGKPITVESCIVKATASKEIFVRDQEYEKAAYLFNEIKLFKAKHGL